MREFFIIERVLGAAILGGPQEYASDSVVGGYRALRGAPLGPLGSRVLACCAIAANAALNGYNARLSGGSIFTVRGPILPPTALRPCRELS